MKNTTQLKTMYALLATRNALAAMSGRPCPVAAKVAQRLEAALDVAELGFTGAVEAWIAEVV